MRDARPIGGEDIGCEQVTVMGSHVEGEDGFSASEKVRGAPEGADGGGLQLDEGWEWDVPCFPGIHDRVSKGSQHEVSAIPGDGGNSTQFDCCNDFFDFGLVTGWTCFTRQEMDSGS